MRKVYGFLATLSVVLGVVVMILGVFLDWSLFPARTGTWIGWTLGFWVLIVGCGFTFCVLWFRANDVYDASSSREVKTSAGDGAELVVRRSVRELAENERQALKREAELLATKQAKESPDSDTT